MTHFERARRLTAAILLLSACLGASACGSDPSSAAEPTPTPQPSPSGENPATITDQSRDVSLTSDFIRAFFVPHGITVDHISLPSAFRGFFSASEFFVPPGTVDDYLTFVGNIYNSTQDLVVMRCRPSEEQEAALDPILATWPNLFAAIVNDYGAQMFTCPPTAMNGDNELFCAAQGFTDQQQVTYVNGMLSMFQAAAQAYATTESTAAIRNRYGAAQAFTGLGFTVKGSANDASLLDAEVLQQSVVPEYLLKNSSLTDAGCHCVQVATYPERDQASFDMNFIWEHGSLNAGACRKINRLGL
jgi:hypothetical protein